MYGADGRRDPLGYAVFDVSAEIDGEVRRLDAASVRVLDIASGRETVSGRRSSATAR